ncbi:MAG: tetratricopeptide repeat protein [Acidobacteriia bacterium]|nr:tetratricopeptide repeat protein [Terriglobia bacterium]
MVRILAKRLLWAAVLLLAGMGAPCRSASMPQSSPETPAIKSPWIYPQPSAVEHRSAKEAKRFEEAWKSFTEGKTKKAQKDWISLLKKHSDSSSLLTALSYIDFMEQEPALAIAKLNAALRADPKYLPAVQTLARYYQSQKDHEKAYRYTATIVELRPDDAQARSDLEELRLLVTDQWIAEAHSARAKAKWQEAEFAYLQAMTVAPELETLPRELGDIYVYEGKWAEAEKSYRRAIGLDGTDLEARKKLADVYVHTNQREKAESLLKELAGQDSQNEEIKSMLDRILDQMNPEEEALREIRQRPQINRGDFGAMMAIRFPFLKEFLTGAPVILTDLGSHWGRKYLPLVAGLDLISASPNHRFRPTLIIRRYEIAVAIDHLLALINRRPSVDISQTKITDVPRTNPNRDAIARVVTLHLMQLDSNDRFIPQAGVTGADAFKILDAVEDFLR